MDRQNLSITLFLIPCLWLLPYLGFGQHLKNVPEAFSALRAKPESMRIANNIGVPAAKGHFQGVQLIEKNGRKKLLISGSSGTTAYILQADLATRKTDTLIALMKEPFRHAGGMQASHPYVVVGIEDNVVKTTSKVGLYDYVGDNLLRARPNIIIDRKGKIERQTAGATGILALNDGYLVVVGNWDSRQWDFYHVDPKTGKQQLRTSFTAPADWPGYQSINLMADDEAIYAIGTYQKEQTGYADLIWVSKRGTFKPIIKKLDTKQFYCADGVDFSGAAGVNVDQQGKLQLWATQKNTGDKILVDRFSQ